MEREGYGVGLTRRLRGPRAPEGRLPRSVIHSAQSPKGGPVRCSPPTTDAISGSFSAETAIITLVFGLFAVDTSPGESSDKCLSSCSKRPQIFVPRTQSFVLNLTPSTRRASVRVGRDIGIDMRANRRSRLFA